MPTTSFHFDIGDSTKGPIGMAGRVTAENPEQALEILKKRLPETVELCFMDNDDGNDGKIEYFNVYINDDAITVSDIDDQEDTDAA